MNTTPSLPLGSLCPLLLMISDFPAHPLWKATGKSREQPGCIMDELDTQWD